MSINVLIVPAGSGMAIVAIKALKQDKKITLVSLDSDFLAPGLYLSHKRYLIPRFEDPNFLTELITIARRENIHFIYPCLDPLLEILCENREKIEDKTGAEIVMSPAESIKLCRDKWNLYTFLNGKVNMPLTLLFEHANLPKDMNFPVIVKPRFGSGSRDIYIANNEEELIFYAKKVPSPIIQEYIQGKEYTVDVLVDRKGKCRIAVPRRRIDVRSGISVKGKIEFREDLINLANRLTKLIKFFGPINFQAIINHSSDEYFLTEINPRISGGMSLTIRAGYNLPLFAIYLAMRHTINIPPVNVKKTLYMTRYYEEIILDGLK